MQRPLKTIARLSGDVYIPRGVSVPALDRDTLWEFQPKKIGNLKAYISHALEAFMLDLFSSIGDVEGSLFLA